MKDWTYFITRNSENGIVLDTCDLWEKKPTRTILDGTISWDGGGRHLGRFIVKDLWKYGFMTYPDTDREVIKTILGVTEQMKSWKFK